MIISAETFVPHTLAHLTEIRAFPTPLPEAAYNKIVKEYEALTDVSVLRIFYESDGLKVTGLTALPVKLTPGAHPLLIYNRGGNREYGKLTVLSAMRSMVPFAQAGYIVFASNYRGNDGGEGMDEFGGRDVDDVLNLLSVGRKDAAYDGKNSFILGHSRGGMMTTMALRRGAGVSAAITIAGVSDMWNAANDRSEIEDKVFSRLIPNFKTQRDTEYEKRSSIRWADELDTPLLLLHGDADEAVDVSQSQHLSDRLAMLGKSHELHIYPGGNHALIRYWDDVKSRCLEWMEGHKK